MLAAEASGLTLLNNSIPGISPAVIAKEEDKEEMMLIIEYVEREPPREKFWKNFASKLSALHRTTITFFGLDHDNYIGSLQQSNKQHTNWNTFFILERLEPQLKKAVDEKKLPAAIHRSFENLFRRLPEIFPEEAPSLLHGDLWSGNYIAGKSDRVCLIDPAVYFGFREMDIAMMKLFAGYHPLLFEHYHELFPLQKGFEERTDICNLYPLLVHVNLFGGQYVERMQTIISRFQSR